MSTKHRRITISLPPELDAALSELAVVDKRPQATICSEYLMELVPTMQAMVKIAKQVKAGRGADAKRTLQHLVGDSMASLITDQNDMFTDKPKAKRK